MLLAELLIVIFFVVLVGAVVNVIGVRRHHYTIDKCFLYVSSGVFWRKTRSYELIHLSEADIKRGFFDLFTRNTRLVLSFNPGGIVVLRGLGRINAVTDLRTKLLNLARMLRMNPLLRVIER